MVVACAAAQVRPPLGPVVREISDLAKLALLAGQLRQAGFGAMQAIHPSQVAPITDAFVITHEQRNEAKRLLNHATGGGATAVDGLMVDEAVLRRARRVLGRAPVF